MIFANDLYGQRITLEDSIGRMRERDTHIAVRNDVIAVSFVSTDPQKAQRVSRTITERLREELLARGEGHGELVQAANLPRSPVAPNRMLIALLGLLAGSLVGVAFGVIRNFNKRTLLYACACGAAGCALSWIGAHFLLADRYVSRSVIRINSDEEYTRVPSALRTAIPVAQQKQVHIDRVPPLNNSRISTLEISVIGEVQSAVQKKNEELVVLASRTGKAASVDVLDHANLPESPAWPNRFLIATLGLGAGLLSGGATAKLRSNR